MPEVGVRELRIHASQIVRDLREQRTRYVITYRGRLVALLMPWDVTSPADLCRPAAHGRLGGVGPAGRGDRSGVVLTSDRHRTPVGNTPLGGGMTSTYTGDASVFLNRFNPYEPGHEESRRLLAML